MSTEKIEEVRDFWNNNPLFMGESEHEVGSKQFFVHHKTVYIEDCFANNLDEEIFMPPSSKGKKILDLGCGVGFWTVEIQQRKPGSQFFNADLTENALKTTEKRLKIYSLESNSSIQNAEKTTFEDNFFDHVNCQGVIHHTPNTEKCVEEISRILKKGGTAYISVYYKNLFLRHWSKISILGKALTKLGGGMKGRGRENIFSSKNTNDIVKLYDGDKNPIGKAYSKNEFLEMVENYFEVKRTDLFFFPARALPFLLPKWLHQFLAKHFGFMIHVQLVKK